MRKIIDNPAGVPKPPAGRYSHVVRLDVGDSAILILSGQVAVDDELNVMAPGDMRGQSERVFEIIGRILEAHCASFADVVNIRTYLTNLDKLREYADVRMKYLPTDRPPTSTTVEVSRLFLPEAVIEIEVLAVVSGSVAEE